MISDQERREIAARLRALDVHDWYDYKDEINSLESAIECNVDQRFETKNWWNRLADLIDRQTCRNVSKQEGGFECSECKFKAEIVGEDCNEYGEVFNTPLMPRFCMFCGRKVVRDGD